MSIFSNNDQSNNNPQDDVDDSRAREESGDFEETDEEGEDLNYKPILTKILNEKKLVSTFMEV